MRNKYTSNPNKYIRVVLDALVDDERLYSMNVYLVADGASIKSQILQVPQATGYCPLSAFQKETQLSEGYFY